MHRETQIGVPYIVHPMNVMRILIDAGCDEDIVIAGLLHDTIEDAHTPEDQIRGAFGERVLQLVKSASEPDKSALLETRKKHTIEHLRLHASGDELALAFADKLDNLRSINEDIERLQPGPEYWDRFNRPYDDQRWYYGELGKIFAEKLTESRFSYFIEEYKRIFERVFQGIWS